MHRYARRWQSRVSGGASSERKSGAWRPRRGQAAFDVEPTPDGDVRRRGVFCKRTTSPEWGLSFPGGLHQAPRWVLLSAG
jgi:hypothetical protein